MIHQFPGGLFGERRGHGESDVLLLHGWGRTHQDFDRLIALDTDGRYTFTAVDLPGFGATPLPERVFSTRDYARALEPLLDEMASPFAAVGHSRGGAIAVCLAALRPEQVGRLVVTGAPLLRRAGAPAKAPLSFRLARSANRFGLLSDDKMEARRRKVGSADYRAATGMLRDILVTVVNETFETELESLRAPTALVWGHDDHDVPVEVAERALGLIPAPRLLRVVRGAGHLTVRDCPEDLYNALEERP